MRSDWWIVGENGCDSGATDGTYRTKGTHRTKGTQNDRFKMIFLRPRMGALRKDYSRAMSEVISVVISTKAWFQAWMRAVGEAESMSVVRV